MDPTKCRYAVACNGFIRRPAKPAEPASAFSNQCLTRRRLRLRARGPASPGNVARGLTALWRGDVDLEPGSARTLWCRGPPSSRHQNRAPRAQHFACPTRYHHAATQLTVRCPPRTINKSISYDV
jgi:hypothetical protein